jgi:hypothetical protein
LKVGIDLAGICILSHFFNSAPLWVSYRSTLGNRFCQIPLIPGDESVLTAFVVLPSS